VIAGAVIGPRRLGAAREQAQTAQECHRKRAHANRTVPTPVGIPHHTYRFVSGSCQIRFVSGPHMVKSGLWTAAKQFALSVPVAVAFNDLGAAHACPARPVCPICRSVPPRSVGTGATHPG
jgi:hypothetical protein